MYNGPASHRGPDETLSPAALRNVTVLPPHHGKGIERRLVEAIEHAAASLGVISVYLGGATGDERDFYLAMGYRGRHAGGLMSKPLPRPPRPRRPSSGPTAAALRLYEADRPAPADPGLVRPVARRPGRR